MGHKLASKNIKDALSACLLYLRVAGTAGAFHELLDETIMLPHVADILLLPTRRNDSNVPILRQCASRASYSSMGEGGEDRKHVHLAIMHAVWSLPYA